MVWLGPYHRAWRVSSPKPLGPNQVFPEFEQPVQKFTSPMSQSTLIKAETVYQKEIIQWYKSTPSTITVISTIEFAASVNHTDFPPDNWSGLETIGESKRKNRGTEAHQPWGRVLWARSRGSTSSGRRARAAAPTWPPAPPHPWRTPPAADTPGPAKALGN